MPRAVYRRVWLPPGALTRAASAMLTGVEWSVRVSAVLDGRNAGRVSQRLHRPPAERPSATTSVNVRDTSRVAGGDGPTFGETTVSWQTVWNYMFPGQGYDLHDDAEAAGMHRLRGLVMAQGAETETVLGKIVARLDPSTEVERRTAGQLLTDVRRLLAVPVATQWADALRLIEQAIRRRNHAVHSPVTIGRTWRPYATGGGEPVPMISLMNDGEYDESDLLRDLALQQDATVAAVRLLHSLGAVD